uniref:Ig-like domain-containing protein n=1 Tax=Xiphophorus maculatus TaxID=8083 RepID=A0A3B5R4S8_XIPMA
GKWEKAVSEPDLKLPSVSSVLPSVFLLQKSPDSPVSCSATGFYPNKAAMFWRKDGEEIQDGVDKTEILCNQDNTFQMRTDINVSSVNPEDWERYECVCHFSEVWLQWRRFYETRLQKSDLGCSAYFG